MNKYAGERISTTHKNQLYFWIAPINGWKHLLAADSMKMEIIQSLLWLKAKELISVYAFVYYAQSYAFDLGIASTEWQGIGKKLALKVYSASFQANTTGYKSGAVGNI